MGWHQPNNGASGPAQLENCLISVNRLLTRKSDFSVQNWILDSGAFTRIMSGKQHISLEEYASIIQRWRRCGILQAAVTQDYPCSPATLKRTRLTIEEHQKLTIDRYDRLLDKILELEHQKQLELEYRYDFYCSDIEDYDPEFANDCFDGYDFDIPYIMPVLQGNKANDYVTHLKAYGDRLEKAMWVGVGSLVGKGPKEIEAILLALKSHRPDLKLHGLGVGKSVLKSAIAWDCLHSADSAVSGFKLSKGQNNPDIAKNYLSSITQLKPIQPTLFSLL